LQIALFEGPKARICSNIAWMTRITPIIAYNIISPMKK